MSEKIPGGIEHKIKLTDEETSSLQNGGWDNGRKILRFALPMLFVGGIALCNVYVAGPKNDMAYIAERWPEITKEWVDYQRCALGYRKENTSDRLLPLIEMGVKGTYDAPVVRECLRRLDFDLGWAHDHRSTTEPMRRLDKARDVVANAIESFDVKNIEQAQYVCKGMQEQRQALVDFGQAYSLDVSAFKPFECRPFESIDQTTAPKWVDLSDKEATLQPRVEENAIALHAIEPSRGEVHWMHTRDGKTWQRTVEKPGDNPVAPDARPTLRSDFTEFWDEQGRLWLTVAVGWEPIELMVMRRDPLGWTRMGVLPKGFEALGVRYLPKTNEIVALGVEGQLKVLAARLKPGEPAATTTLLHEGNFSKVLWHEILPDGAIVLDLDIREGLDGAGRVAISLPAGAKAPHTTRQPSKTAPSAIRMCRQGQSLWWWSAPLTLSHSVDGGKSWSTLELMRLSRAEPDWSETLYADSDARMRCGPDGMLFVVGAQKTKEEPGLLYGVVCDAKRCFDSSLEIGGFDFADGHWTSEGVEVVTSANGLAMVWSSRSVLQEPFIRQEPFILQKVLTYKTDSPQSLGVVRLGERFVRVSTGQKPQGRTTTP